MERKQEWQARVETPSVSEEKTAKLAQIVGEWRQSRGSSPVKLRRYMQKQIGLEDHGKLWQVLIEPEKLRDNSHFNYKEAKETVDCLLTYYGLEGHTDASARRLRDVIEKLESLESVEASEEEDHPAKNLVEFLLIGRDKKSAHDKNEAKELSAVVRYLKSIHQIFLDLDRTFCSYSAPNEGLGKEKTDELFYVLAVYSIYNPVVGYCQGMSYIAGMLVMNMDEETAFWIMASMMEREKHLSGYYSLHLSKLHHHSEVFHRILHHRLPDTAKHLDAMGIQPLMYVTQWFLSLFTCLPCWKAVLSVWDCFMIDGVTTVFQAALAILQLSSDKLLAMEDVGSIMMYLTHLPEENALWDDFITLLWSIKVPKWQQEGLSNPSSSSSGRSRSRKRRHATSGEETTDGGKSESKKRKTDAASISPPSNGWLQRLIQFVSLSKPSTPRRQHEQFELKPLRSNTKRTPHRRRSSRRIHKKSRENQRLIDVSLTESPSKRPCFYEFNTPTPLRPSQVKRRETPEDSPLSFYYELGEIA